MSKRFKSGGLGAYSRVGHEQCMDDGQNHTESF